MVIVTLSEYLYWEVEIVNATLLIFLDLSVAFDTISQGILLDHASGLVLGGTVLE